MIFRLDMKDCLKKIRLITIKKMKDIIPYNPDMDSWYGKFTDGWIMDTMNAPNIKPY